MNTEAGGRLAINAFFSANFPTGSFAYSGGIEAAAAAGRIAGTAALGEWITGQLTRGGLRNDAVLFACAMRAGDNKQDLADLSALAEALATSASRHREAMDQGAAFAAAAQHFLPQGKRLAGDFAYSVASGAACAMLGLAISEALALFLQSAVSNQLQCAIRLCLLGQADAAALLAKLQPVIAEAAECASRTTVEELGGAALLADIAAMQHDRLSPRLFLS